MGESTCVKEKINNILSINDIKILEKINKKFSNKIIVHFSDFIKHHTKLNFFSININTYTHNDKYIKYLLFNEIEILNSKKRSFIFFSDNLLSVLIDLLFGGNGISTEKINKVRNITYIEKITTQKMLKLILNVYCLFFKQYFSIDLNIINTKIFKIEKLFFQKENYISNYFDFSINGINVFFSILLPISIIKKKFKEIIFNKIDKKSLIKNINLQKNIPIINLYNIELDIIVKLITLVKTKYNSLSIGDVLMVENPNKVISWIEKIPMFFGCYKNFDEKSVVFLRKFIYKNLDINEYKEFFNE
ncbi:hypothetical protein RJT32_00400 [Buchnera aphidicola (Aphis aurantii)]|uniref:hypothetical protein n=1 Tax=Buchnera aphidicola TaxID=9 RepID=UPI0031B6B1FB